MMWRTEFIAIANIRSRLSSSLATAILSSTLLQPLLDILCTPHQVFIDLKFFLDKPLALAAEKAAVSLAHRYPIFLCSWNDEIDDSLVGQLTAVSLLLFLPS